MATLLSRLPCKAAQLCPVRTPFLPPTIQHALLQLFNVVLGHALGVGQHQRHQLRHAHLQHSRPRSACGPEHLASRGMHEGSWPNTRFQPQEPRRLPAAGWAPCNGLYCLARAHLVHPQIGIWRDDGSPREVNTLARQVAAEAPLLSLQPLNKAAAGGGPGPCWGGGKAGSKWQNTAGASVASRPWGWPQVPSQQAPSACRVWRRCHLPHGLARHLIHRAEARQVRIDVHGALDLQKVCRRRRGKGGRGEGSGAEQRGCWGARATTMTATCRESRQQPGLQAQAARPAPAAHPSSP